MNKKLIVITIFLLTFTWAISDISASKLLVEILPVIKGETRYINYSTDVNQTPQKIWTYWEDKGSVGCTNRLRIDIYNASIDKLTKPGNFSIDPLNITNQNRRIYTAWSKAVQFNSGANDNLITYWYPYNISGNFTAQFRLYSCNEIYEKPPFMFEVMPWKEFPPINEENELFDKIEIKNINESNIEIRVKPKEDMNNTLIIPEKYPHGWIFEYGYFDKMKKGKEYSANINYAAGIWSPENVTLAFVTEDGKHYFQKTFLIKKEPSFDWAAVIAIWGWFIAIISLLYILNRKTESKDETIKQKDRKAKK